MLKPLFTPGYTNNVFRYDAKIYTLYNQPHLYWVDFICLTIRARFYHYNFMMEKLFHAHFTYCFYIHA